MLRRADFYEDLRELIRAVKATAADAYADLEIGTAQAKLVRHIGEHGPLSQAELARATLTAPTLTGRALDPLVERGWVRRQRSDEDRRQYLVELTAAGQRARAAIDARRGKLIERITAALDDRDVADFERITKKILTALEKG